MKEKKEPLEDHVFDASEYVKLSGTRRLGPNENSVPMDVVVGLVEAAKAVSKEHYGIQHAWCGNWFKCQNCSNTYSIGGNWLGIEKHCPNCQIDEALLKFEAWQKGRGDK